MSISEIGREAPSVPPLDRSVFPVTRRWAYLNHASVGPLPQPSRDAIVAALDAQMADGCAGILDVEAHKEAVRAQAAAAIGASPDEIAFMRSTSDGALLVANGIDWEEGDEIVTSADEFGSDAYAWLNLRDRGVTCVFARPPERRLTVELLERVATKRTRLVAVSYVGFYDGYRHDLPALGAWCRRRGVLFAVDAMQGFGQLALDVAACHIDFCYFGVAKWLLSPQALSIVYVRRALVDGLRPALCSWRSMRDPMDFLDYTQPFADGATRFDGATVNYPALLAFRESLRLLTKAGLDKIERHVLALGEHLVRGASRIGRRVLSDLTPKNRSGITLLSREKDSVEHLSRRVDSAKVQVTIRDAGIRVSPHGYNTIEEIDRTLDALS
ncbi:MAG TPA: aminotransferase class V-fold PLP-dependent enzyme [Candidatus Eremiobacteraceae bacterium]|nr:aminotransferase class V-fold PLP-dependent enzyme [Candidatus Eremiobacteraceae bacterium]